ncbi:unnamed protein product [Linum trigynum]|uniref:Zinc finger GRF-type domain-containing protein n=1 Tax=Linum trigynum TaxID=586398 RepID=A0AAV2GKW9_9ROSI
MSRRVGRRNIGRNFADSRSTNIKSEGAGVVICRCKVPALVQTSGTELNPDIQFYGFPNWMDPKGGCNFFRWVGSSSDISKARNNEVDGMMMKLEESLRLAESKAVIKKKDNKLREEELCNWMKIEKDRIVEAQNLYHEIRVIRYMLSFFLVLNILLVVVLWM